MTYCVNILVVHPSVKEYLDFPISAYSEYSRMNTVEQISVWKGEESFGHML